MIDFVRWKPSVLNPHTIEKDGQRTAYEVYMELRSKLESTGYLPDEYFMLDDFWSNGKEIPEDAYTFNTVDYGGSEGIYLDIYLKWHEGGEARTKSFITGKTLGDRPNDMDRMNLISSAVTQALNGSGGVHARYIKIGGSNEPEGITLTLNAEERAQLTDSLLEARALRKGDGQSCEGIDRMMRRIIGNVTEYVQTVGGREHLDNTDLAILAVRDCNLDAFQSLLPEVVDSFDQLLVHAAGQPGRIGRVMTDTLLDRMSEVPMDVYRPACEQAADIGDTDRVLAMLKRGPQIVKDYDPALCGEIMRHSMESRWEHRRGSKMASDILKQASPNEIAAASTTLIADALFYKNYYFADDLVSSGIELHEESDKLFYQVASRQSYSWLIRSLKNAGADIDGHNHGALRRCAYANNVEAAETLIDFGADYKEFRAFMNKHDPPESQKKFLAAMDEYYERKFPGQLFGQEIDGEIPAQTFGEQQL